MQSVTDDRRAAGHIGAVLVLDDAPGFSAEIAATTRERKSGDRGASAALFVPAFLLLARAGLLQWFVAHQHAVQTFVTNLRGPEAPLRIDGAGVRAIIPIPSTTGNVTVTFAAVSYAGTLRVAILCDPARVPDVSVLVAALRRELSVSQAK